jgi:hypothetical protein
MNNENTKPNTCPHHVNPAESYIERLRNWKYDPNQSLGLAIAEIDWLVLNHLANMGGKVRKC